MRFHSLSGATRAQRTPPPSDFPPQRTLLLFIKLFEPPLATRKRCMLHWGGLCSASMGVTRARRQRREAFVLLYLTAH